MEQVDAMIDPMKDRLIRYFEIDIRRSSIFREFVAGLTTYITMAYIVVINPTMMAQAGMNYGASFTATCLAAALATFAMGVVANWPVALAPGVGLSAFFTFTVVGELGYSWQVALGAVFLSSILFIVISLTPLRKWILASIPVNLRFAIAAGIGIFIGFIGLRNSGIVVSDSANYVSLGDLASAETFLGLLGFLLITVLSIRHIPGAIILGIASITGVAVALGKVEYSGWIAKPPSLTPVFLELDVLGAMNAGMITVVLAFLFVNLFDTAGTLFAVADSAKLTDKNNANELDYSKIGWQFTLEDSADALLGYDTEYRDCITEQFDDACNDACEDKFWQQHADADFTTLAARIFAKRGYSCYE